MAQNKTESSAPSQSNSPGQTSPVKKTIKGTITDQENKPVARVVLELVGTSFTCETDERGNYVLTYVSGSEICTLTPRRAAYKFEPENLLISFHTADSFRQDFKATLQSYALSGTLRDWSGTPLKDVIILLSGGQTSEKRSDSRGNYVFPNIAGGSSYTISPDTTKYTFTPTSQPVVYLADDLHHSFFGSPEFDRDKPPSQWNIINDYSKTIITLASGLLAVTATFSGQLTGKSSDRWSTGLLIGTWILLVLTIFSGVLTTVFVIQFLRNNRDGKYAILFANGSYLTLGLAGILFLAFGIYTITLPSKGWDAATAVEQVLKKMPEFTGTTDAKWNLQSLQWDESSKTYKLLIEGDRTADKFRIEVEPTYTRIIKVEKLLLPANPPNQ